MFETIFRYLTKHNSTVIYVSMWCNTGLGQCWATYLHPRHTKYCQRVMAAHQPHFAYCGGGGGLCMALIGRDNFLKNRPQSKNVLFDVHNYASLLLCHLF
jgi:hypothetical protein